MKRCWRKNESVHRPAEEAEIAEPGRAGWKRDSKEELPLLYGKLLLVDDARALMGEWEVESVDDLSFLDEEGLRTLTLCLAKAPAARFLAAVGCANRAVTTAGAGDALGVN